MYTNLAAISLIYRLPYPSFSYFCSSFFRMAKHLSLVSPSSLELLTPQFVFQHSPSFCRWPLAMNGVASIVLCFKINFKLCIHDGALGAPKQLSVPLFRPIFTICTIFTLSIYFLTNYLLKYIQSPFNVST